jgi:hypothetical protein
MKALSLLAVLLAALAASACRKQVKAEAPPPDYDKARQNATRSHGALDAESGD